METNKWTTYSKRQGMISKKKKTKIIQDYIKLLDEVDELKSKLFESNNKRNVLEDQNVDLEKELIKSEENQNKKYTQFLEEKVFLLEKVISLTEEKDRAKVIYSTEHGVNGMITTSSTTASSIGNSTGFTK
jgi:septal ring factor EnvC (AmiA/AmiB activator)